MYLGGYVRSRGGRGAVMRPAWGSVLFWVESYGARSASATPAVPPRLLLICRHIRLVKSGQRRMDPRGGAGIRRR